MSHSYSTNPTSSLPRRRNGRPQACEPCSRRKLACDHRLPICSRCRRGRISQKCVYLPERRVVLAMASPAPSPDVLSHSGAGDATTASPAAAAAAGPIARPESSAGYLGATSFSAVIKETQDILSTPQGPPSHRDGGLAAEGSIEETALDSETLGIALDILRSIPKRPVAYVMFKHYTNPNNGWCLLACERLMDSFWATFGSCFERVSQQAQERSLLWLAEKLCSNTSQHWPEDEADPNEWFAAISGQNFRWESLGVLCIFWAFGRESYPKDDVSINGDRALVGTERRRLLVKYQTCAWKCSELCRRAKSCNTLVLWVRWKHCLLESMVSGDAEIETWRLHAEVVALTTFLGLHASPGSPSDRSMSVQVKRRLFAAIYKIDKVIAIFTGRPPLLSRRYISTPLPLDISDEELWREVPAAPQELDANGWNMVGRLYVTTVLRARTMVASVGEGILEIALQGSGQDTRAKLLDLRNEQMQMISQFPSALVYEDGDAKRESICGTALYTKLNVWLEHLQNLFLIERLLSREANPSRANLIQVSFEMVTTALLFWTHRNRLDFLHNDHEWLLMQYAVPAGGVLCMELLRRQTPAPAPTTSEDDDQEAALLLSVTRSDMVQQLSILVGFLDWVGPDAPNKSLCEGANKVVRHVLDEVLNGGSRGTDQHSAVETVAANLDLDFSADLNDYFSFDLMDTFDWLRPDGLGVM